MPQKGGGAKSVTLPRGGTVLEIGGRETETVIGRKRLRRGERAKGGTIDQGYKRIKRLELGDRNGTAPVGPRERKRHSTQEERGGSTSSSQTRAKTEKKGRTRTRERGRTFWESFPVSR